MGGSNTRQENKAGERKHTQSHLDGMKGKGKIQNGGIR